MRCRLAFLVVLSALCIPAQLGTSAQAAEAFELTIVTDGTGTGTVECEVDGDPVEDCADQYPEGTELVLIPGPDPGSEFTGFSGDCGPDECELTMSEDRSITATFDLVPVEEFALTLKTSGTGSGTVKCQVGVGPVETCDPTYPEGTELALVPEAASDSEFLRFSGDCEEETCDLTMEEAHSVTVVFGLIPPIPEYAFTLKIKGTGNGTVLCEAQEGPEECRQTYPEETELALLQQAAPGSEFAGWSGGGCSGTGACEVTMSAARSVTATFNLIPPEFEYLLAVEPIGTGSGTVTSNPAGIECGSDCSETFFEGTKVLLVATPAQGSVFDHWSGGSCAGTDTCTATMSTNRTVKAVFAAVGQRTLRVSKAGAGAVKSSPAGIDCGSACTASFNVGTKVTLTATAATGSRFTGFSGACTGTATCKVTMDEARDVSATFEKVPNGTARAAARAKVKAGKALLRISCPGEGACKGKLKLLARIGSGGKRVTIGTASFSVAPDASRTLRIGLVRKAKKMLSRSDTGLAARVSGTGVKARQVRLKLA